MKKRGIITVITFLLIVMCLPFVIGVQCPSQTSSQYNPLTGNYDQVTTYSCPSGSYKHSSDNICPVGDEVACEIPYTGDDSGIGTSSSVCCYNMTEINTDIPIDGTKTYSTGPRDKSYSLSCHSPGGFTGNSEGTTGDSSGTGSTAVSVILNGCQDSSGNIVCEGTEAGETYMDECELSGQLDSYPPYVYKTTVKVKNNNKGAFWVNEKRYSLEDGTYEVVKYDTVCRFEDETGVKLSAEIKSIRFPQGIGCSGTSTFLHDEWSGCCLEGDCNNGVSYGSESSSYSYSAKCEIIQLYGWCSHEMNKFDTSAELDCTGFKYYGTSSAYDLFTGYKELYGTALLNVSTFFWDAWRPEGDSFDFTLNPDNDQFHEKLCNQMANGAQNDSDPQVYLTPEDLGLSDEEGKKYFRYCCGDDPLIDLTMMSDDNTHYCFYNMSSEIGDGRWRWISAESNGEHKIFEESLFRSDLITNGSGSDAYWLVCDNLAYFPFPQYLSLQPSNPNWLGPYLDGIGCPDGLCDDIRIDGKLTDWGTYFGRMRLGRTPFTFGGTYSYDIPETEASGVGDDDCITNCDDEETENVDYPGDRSLSCKSQLNPLGLNEIICKPSQGKTCPTDKRYLSSEMNDDDQGICCASSCVETSEMTCSDAAELLGYTQAGECMLGETCEDITINATGSSNICCSKKTACKASENLINSQIGSTGSSLMCYSNNQHSFIGECCSEYAPQKCTNLDARPGIRLFMTGEASQGLDTYNTVSGSSEFSDTIRKQSVTKNTYIRIPYSSEGTTTLSELKRSNWGNFDYLEFDIKYGGESDNYDVAGLGNIVIYKWDSSSGEYVLFNKDLDDYTTAPSIMGVWLHVKIPLSELSGLGQVDIIDIYGDQENLATTIYMDDVKLTTDDPGLLLSSYYCSAEFGTWIKDLDPTSKVTMDSDFSEYGPYALACNHQKSFNWTGGYCCGDDTIKNTIRPYNPETNNAEYYNDIQAGCFGGKAVFEDQRVNDSFNDAVMRQDLIFDEKFLICNDNLELGVGDVTLRNVLSGNGTSSSSLVLEARNHCDISGSYFCDYHNRWNGLSTEDNYPGLPDDAGYAARFRNTHKTLYDASNQIVNGGFESDMYYWELDTNCAISSASAYTGEKSLSCNSQNTYTLKIPRLLLRKENTTIGFVINATAQPDVKITLNNTINLDVSVQKNEATGWYEISSQIKNTQITNVTSLAITITPGSSSKLIYIDDVYAYSNNSLYKINNNNAKGLAGDAHGCCPNQYCWNGYECEDSEKYENQSWQEPPIFADETDATSENYKLGPRCIDGEWHDSPLKWDPIHEESGYCPYDNQCFIENNPNSRLYNNKNASIINGCVPDGYYLDYFDPQSRDDQSNKINKSQDYYCLNGTWSTRTKFMMITFLETVVRNQEPDKYTIFCDDQTQALNDYTLGGLELDDPRVNSFCVLEYQKSDKIFNAQNGIIIATSLNYPINQSVKKQNTNILNLNTVSTYKPFIEVLGENNSACKNAMETEQNNKTSFILCEKGKNQIWYNNYSQSVIFTRQEGMDLTDLFSKQNTGQLIDYINWFETAVNWFKNNIIQNIRNLFGLVKDDETLKLLNVELRENTFNALTEKSMYDKVYIYNDSKKQIIAIKEDKYNTNQIRDVVYIQYYNFNSSICKNDGLSINLPINTVSNKIFPGEDQFMICKNESNRQQTIIIEGVSIINNWKDLTAKLRPK